MIEIRLAGTIKDVDAAIERLGQSFEILSVSRVYPNRGSQLVKQYLKVETRPASGLGRAGLRDLIQAMLADSHQGIQEAINPTPELSAYHAGLQAGLMTLAKLAGVIPEEEPAPKPKAKRKPGRPKSKAQGFWLETESGPIHCMADPAMADDSEFRAAVEAMSKAAKEEADKFNEEQTADDSSPM